MITRKYLTKAEENSLPENAKKELAYLRKTLKNIKDERLFLIYSIHGDPIPKKLEKFEDRWAI